MKICLVAHFAYGALTGEEVGHIGGVERQAALFAEWLSSRGHEVSVICWNEGTVTRAGKVRIIKLCRQDDGYPGLRFIHPRWSSLIRALREADADIYYQNCAEYVTGQVALWCRRHHRPFVYSVASNADCEAELPNLEHWRARSLFRYGLKNADMVIAQTYHQTDMLRENYGVRARVIRMPGTPPVVDENISDRDKFEAQKVIWVARIHPVKRIGWLFDIAEALPHLKFEVVGPLDESQRDASAIKTRLLETDNIDFVGKIKRDDMPAIYQGASLLCCTSIYEGFPNTYLEAWSYGVPVVTTIDPDNLIMDRQLGFASQEKSQLIEAIREIMGDFSRWQRQSENSRQYYLANHQLDPIQRQFEHELKNLVRYGPTLDHFEQESQQWADYYLDQPNSLSHLDVQQRLTHVASLLRQDGEHSCTRVLDLGCGTGDAISFIPEVEQVEIVSTDYSFGMVRRTTRNFESSKGIVSDARCIPFRAGHFNCVLALGLLEYTHEYEKVLEESRHALSDNGRFLVSVPNRMSLFRQLRNIEVFLLRPVKFLSQLMFGGRATENYYHRQWLPAEIVDDLERHRFEMTDIRYCSYGFLTPRLTSARLNMWLCKYLNRSLSDKPLLQKLLAHTIVILARPC